MYTIQEDGLFKGKEVFPHLTAYLQVSSFEKEGVGVFLVSKVLLAATLGKALSGL